MAALAQTVNAGRARRFRHSYSLNARDIDLGEIRMATAQKMTKSALFAFFADKFEVKRTEVRDWFDELAALAEKEIKRSGEFTLPGMVKLSVRKSKARMGRNPATGEPIKIPAKTRVKATVVKAMKDAVMPRK